MEVGPRAFRFALHGGQLFHDFFPRSTIAEKYEKMRDVNRVGKTITKLALVKIYRFGNGRFYCIYNCWKLACPRN